MTLNLDPNLADPDDFYRELIDSQREMDDEQAALMNCKLVLLLANHIGDRDLFREALRIAGGVEAVFPSPREPHGCPEKMSQASQSVAAHVPQNRGSR